jgi:hypothetical protein
VSLKPVQPGGIGHKKHKKHKKDGAGFSGLGFPVGAERVWRAGGRTNSENSAASVFSVLEIFLQATEKLGLVATLQFMLPHTNHRPSAVAGPMADKAAGAELVEQASTVLVREFMFPESQHMPPQAEQGGIYAAVPRPVALDLGLPERRAGCRPSGMLRAAVPETAVHEHGDLPCPP